MPYTNIIIDIPHAVYTAIYALLTATNHLNTYRDVKGVEVIGMRGIDLRSKGGPPGTDITVSTLLSSRTKKGRIDFALNGELTQMDLDKAREVTRMLQEAIEAAISDELLYRFLVEKVGMEPERANFALIDFRELRQGSRNIVHPH